MHARLDPLAGHPWRIPEVIRDESPERRLSRAMGTRHRATYPAVGQIMTDELPSILVTPTVGLMGHESARVLRASSRAHGSLEREGATHKLLGS